MSTWTLRVKARSGIALVFGLWREELCGLLSVLFLGV